MTPERWTRVEALYHAARARPSGERAAFLAEACRDDEPLRREVESLLNEPVSEVGFVAGPALAMAAQMVTDVLPAPPTLMTGRLLGGYQLQRLLGAGGMGEVYLARDAKLGRDVAIKILPRAVTSDPDRLARFEREARMLAALNHPNICAIHGLEEANGIRFLILELVDGETLADVIGHGSGLSMAQALPIARQIAEALEAAHEKGIIHRDLKPANIKITADGVVKVLDFGIAKAISADAGSDPMQSPTTMGGTREGMILGTAAYMSPEQARGKLVDKRADIWAFGCVLYEMLTGRVTFAGDTVSDTIGKILEREPDWSALPATTPTPVRRLLVRCLAKDPKQRLRDIGDVRIEIAAIDEVLPGAPDPAPRAPAASRSWLPWVALVALAAGVAVREVRRPAIPQENPLVNAKFSRLTQWEGTEGNAEVSPDGRFVAFIADPDGEYDLFVSQIGTQTFRNLTSDIPSLNVPGGLLRTHGFSDDGSEIWFSQSSNPSARKVLVPLTGDTSRAFLSEGDAAPSWSPDGTRLVYFNNVKGDPLQTADRTGRDHHELEIKVTDPTDWSGAVTRIVHNHNPVWSPDNQWIYFLHGFVTANQTDEMDVWRLSPAGGTPERLTRHPGAVMRLAPIDPQTLLFVARADDGSGPWLWVFDVAKKLTRRVNTLEQYTTVASSRDGRRVVATSAHPTATLWSVPLDRLAEDHDALPYQGLPARALAPRFGGTSLFYLSARGTGDGLWRLQDGKESEVWRGAEEPLSEPPAISRDGTRVAVVRRRQDRQHLAIMSADGTRSQTLAESIDIQGTADWSPDGTSIVAGGSNAEGPGLFMIPVDGRPPVRLRAGEALNPIWSRDGSLIVYSGPVVAGSVALFGFRPDGAAVVLPDVRVRPGGYRFLPDGTGLVYRSYADSANFSRLDFATKKMRLLTRLTNQGRLSSFDITPDGKRIVFDRLRENSDIVLIQLPEVGDRR